MSWKPTKSKSSKKMGKANIRFGKKRKLVTEDYIKDWQNKTVAGWKSDQISHLQIRLGLDPTGAWNTATAKAQLQWFKDRTAFGETAAKNQMAYNVDKYKASGGATSWVATPGGVVKMSAEEADRYEAEKQYEDDLEAKRKERQKIEQDMFDTWKNLTGVTATKANVNWATEKSLQGWGYDDFYFWMKDRPEMKRMYPGMPKGMMPSEYLERKNQINAAFMETGGRPLSRKEIANVMKGGDFPDFFFIGEPAVRDVEFR